MIRTRIILKMHFVKGADPDKEKQRLADLANKFGAKVVDWPSRFSAIALVPNEASAKFRRALSHRYKVTSEDAGMKQLPRHRFAA